MFVFLIAVSQALDPMIVDSPLYAPQYCIQRNTDRESKDWLETMFTLSEKGRVYKSSTNGKVWLDESQVFEKMGLNDSYYELQISPAARDVVFIFGRNGTGIRSEDCGNHYTWFKYDPQLQDFKLNSMDDEWMLAFSFCERCKSPFNRDLHKSTDGGKTWTWILSDVMMAAWDKLIDSELIPDERIVACHLEANKSRVIYSDDYFSSQRVIHANGTGFFQTQFHMFVISKFETSYRLHVAPAFYDYADMRNVSIPFDEQYSFTLLDTESESIFLSVSHNSSNKKLTNIYTSEYQGFKFTISLLNNVRSLNTGQCDFEKIESLKGVYIANIYDHEKLWLPQSEKYRKTVITFDKGGLWHPLKVPAKDSDGQPIICSGDCSLHLQGRSVSKIYREARAVGLIMASGNVGMYLDEKIINTYFSRDGGHTWYEVRKGHHIYAFGDRGGLIVMAKAHVMTDELLYSWDEGLTWESIEIPKIIVTSIQSRSLYINFIIMGIDASRKGVILNADFSSLHQRTCTGIWDPTDPDSDYEFWIPKNYENGKCLFGQRERYTRRKREAKCFNQMDHDKVRFLDACECTAEDWECDYGFYRKIEGGPCVPIAQMFEEDEYIDILKPPENCNGTYEKTQGYRKIVGDYCTGGLNLDPITTPCEEGLEQSLIKPQMSIKEEQAKLNQVVQPPPPLDYTYFIILLLGIVLVYIVYRLCMKKDEEKGNKQNIFQLINKSEQIRLFDEDNNDI